MRSTSVPVLPYYNILRLATYDGSCDTAAWRLRCNNTLFQLHYNIVSATSPTNHLCSITDVRNDWARKKSFFSVDFIKHSFRHTIQRVGSTYGKTSKPPICSTLRLICSLQGMSRSACQYLLVSMCLGISLCSYTALKTDKP